MKHTAGYAKSRRITAPMRTSRLNLQRRPKPAPEDDLDSHSGSPFWKWVLLVALLHLLVIAGAYFYYLLSPATKPEEHFMSLVPPGDLVKGTPGAQQAHKLGANTPAAPAHHAAPPPPAATASAQPKVVTPIPPVVKPPTPTPAIKDLAPPIAPPKPAPPKPMPPKPRVKVDLHLVDGPTTAEDKPAKHHAKKPEKKTTDEANDESDSNPDNTGLTREQIAEKLGEKMNASGAKNAIKSGVSGSTDGRENRFQEFYDLIGQQVHEDWNSPNASSAVQTEPVVHIHVERDGRVPPEDVYLLSSSGDPAYDAEAIQTVKNLGRLQEPLPEGCPPDIKINFNPNP